MKIARPKSLTDLVVDELRARIIDGRLRLGEALSENALAADLGISKTPVREACCSSSSSGWWTCCRSAAPTSSGWPRPSRP